MVEQSGNLPVIEGGQSHCCDCKSPLCLRKQVINLALGHVDDMYCLNCLGKNSEREPQEVLGGIKDYILSRACFKKEWVKYPNASHCPEPETCFPTICFEDEL
jgi:hypothetical protein